MQTYTNASKTSLDNNLNSCVVKVVSLYRHKHYRTLEWSQLSQLVNGVYNVIL